MRAWIFSDLHRSDSCVPESLPVPDADICLCSGGVSRRGPEHAVKFLGEKVSSIMPVILVPGNFDYHRSSIIEGGRDAAIAAASYPNVHLLNRTTVFIGGFRFIGATLWGDAELAVSEGLRLFFARRDASDFLKIKLSRQPSRRFSSIELGTLKREDTDFIKTALGQSNDTPTVVITHHAPSRRSLPDTYLSACGLCRPTGDLETEIRRWKPEMWVHGNLRSRHDYYISKTRVICNPRGPRECPVPDFDPGLVVELTSSCQGKLEPVQRCDVSIS
ncbi:metallophosphoesterase [Rhizobium oryzicola]|uniref:metallophosphoesterase n=1 Tax=Rhizobium oryzicola TaxID=1232668 RepID=UPI00345BBCF1